MQQNNQEISPQAHAISAEAGGQDSLEALRAAIDSQTASSNANETSAPAQQAPVEPSPAATEKMYAGKFKSDAELEKGYEELEKKIGSKTELERIGEKLLKYSGRSPEELQAELDNALAQAQSPQGTSPQVTTPATPADPRVDKIEAELKAMKAKELLAQMHAEEQALFAKYPDAANVKDKLETIWKGVEVTKNMEQIYEDWFKPTQESIAKQQSDKEKENFQVASVNGQPAGIDLGAIDPSKLTLEQLAQILPKAER